MANIIQQLESEQMAGKKIPKFKTGDTIIVKVKVKEGERERLQSYEGIVIAKRNRGLNSSFTVRKVSHGEGVERVFQTYSPQVHNVIIKRLGDVRRAKLYYLRKLSGRKARIKEKIKAKKTTVSSITKTQANMIAEISALKKEANPNEQSAQKE